MPFAKGLYRTPIEERFKRFWDKMEKPDDGCWIWPGSKAAGYGTIFVEYRTKHATMMKAHRLSYMIHVGAIPPDKEICHSCDTPPCIRPSHLFLGTHQDNIADAKRKGRMAHIGQNSPRGENHPTSKLTQNAIKEIRATYAAGDTSMSTLGQRFGVSASLIYHIVRNHRWKDVIATDARMVNRARRTSVDIMKEIQERYLAGETPTQLGKIYNLTRGRVWGIGHGRFKS